MTFPKLLGLHFPDLEINILNSRDVSRFSMTVRPRHRSYSQSYTNEEPKLFLAHLFLPVFDFVVVLREGRLDLFDAQPDAEGLLLHGVLLLPQDLYLLQHPLVLLLHLRQRGLEDETKAGHSL